MIKHSLIFFFILISTLYAQTLNEIKVSGARNFSRQEFIKWSGFYTGAKLSPGSLDSAKKTILLNLADEGYYYSKVNLIHNALPDTSKSALLIEVNEGQPVYVNNIFIDGANEPDSILFIEKFSYLTNNILTKNNLENRIDEMLDYYEENGFPFSRINVNSIYFFRDSLLDKNLADIYLGVNTGTLSRVDKIEILGNTSTKDYVIIRDARVNTGEYYSQKQLEKIPEKLNRLRFFEPVEVPSFYFNSRNEGVLQINIKEKQTNNFDGVLGYIPGRDKEKGYVTGLVNISLRNLFGTGRGAAINWQQIDRYSQEMELKYFEPWLINLPFNINLSLYQLKQDTSYVQRRVEGAFEFLASETISASFLLSTESIIPVESDYSVFTVYNSSILSSGFNLKIDTRNDYYSPATGIFFLNSYSFSKKKINGPEKYLTSEREPNIYLQRFAIDFNIFKEIFQHQVIAAAIHGREMKGSSFELSDLYKLGGANTLRGYRENQFLANRILWSNLEYRLLLSPRSYTFLFFDAGYYLRKDQIDRVKQTIIPGSSAVKLGYGLGLNIETGLGVLAVSYAMAKGDSFSEGKIHFGIINEF